MNNEIESTKITGNLTDKEIFLKIWTSPREVFKFVNDNHYDKYMHILLFLAGISRAFERATVKDLGDKMPLWGLLGFCIVFGGLLGWISYYLYAALLSWTGKWLDGKGDRTSILRILSYAKTPALVGLLFLIPQIGIYGIELFKAEGDITSAGLVSNIFFYGSMFLEFVLGIWSLVLCVIAVSEVQKFSIGKSILNLLLPVLIFVVPLIIVGMIFQVF